MKPRQFFTLEDKQIVLTGKSSGIFMSNVNLMCRTVVDLFLSTDKSSAVPKTWSAECGV